jgi:hypothetical protein
MQLARDAAVVLERVLVREQVLGQWGNSVAIHRHSRL